MKKWNNGSFNRTKLATAVAVVSLGLMAGGCGSDGDRSVSTSTTAGGVTQIHAPKGSVTGHVQDTNGNPIAGATVNVAGQSVTTDASGQYYIESVQVVGVTGADGPQAGGALQVVVQAPGHLGATVTVTPRAQIDGTPGDSNGTANQNVGNVNNNTVFVDGFLAAAGTTVLPKLAATVTGNLRDGRTGEALVGATVSLDFQARLQPTQNQSQAINGVAVSYAVNQNWQATTGANGLFTLSGLPEDSSFTLAVQSSLAAGGVGYTVVGIANPGDVGGLVNANGANIGTTNEGIAQILGTVTVLPIVSTDTIRPVVSSVTTVKNPYDVTARAPDPSRAGQVAARPAGALDDDEVQTVRINFSEVMNGAAIDENSVVIWNSTLGVYHQLGTDFTVAALTTNAFGASVLTINFTNPFPASQANFLEVLLLVDDFADTAGNLIAEGSTFLPAANQPAGVGGNTLNDIAYDNILNTSKATYLRLDLCTFLQSPTGADQVTPTQLATVGLPAAQFPGTGTSEITALTTYSGAFNDVEDTRNLFANGNSIDQLNVAEAGARLTALGTALQGAAVTHNVDRGLVTFTVPATNPAASYRVTAAQGGGAINVTLATPNLTDVDAAATAVQVNGAAVGTPIEVLVGPGAVAAQTTVTVTPLDGFGNSGGSTTITLVDNVQPTVILQSAHGLAGTVGAGLVTPFGDGAEITSPGQAAQLSPAWRVNPGHFTESRSTDTPLSQLLENASNTAMARAGSANGGDNINIVYDRTAYAARTGNQGFTSAVSVSESLASAALTLTNGGTASISGVAVQNDVTQSVWGENGNLQNIPGDLIRFSVNDIVLMAAAHGAQLDAAGSVDLAGNTAAASAFATVVDNFPPLVTSAVYSAAGLTIDFNEALAPLASQVAGASIVIRYEAGFAQNISLTQPGVVCATTAEQSVQFQNNNTRLFFSTCYLNAAGFNYNTAFTTNLATSPLGNYTEAAYGLTQTNNRHTSLVWSSIRDARLNSWASVLPTDTADPNPNFAGCAGNVPAPASCLKWTGLGTNPAAGGAGTGQSPIFALIDGLGPFVITQANAGFSTTAAGGGATNVGSFVLTFSHPFYVSQNNTVDSENNAQARLALSDVANAANPANTNTTISAANCGAFFTYVANPAVADSDFPPTAGAQSSCTVVFAETGTATSAGGTSSGITVTVTKRTTGGVASNITVGDEVRVRPTHIFQSALTRELATVTVSPAN